MIDAYDYLAGVGLNYAFVPHLTVQSCPLLIRHQHVRCASCGERYTLDLDEFQQVTAHRLRKHVREHRIT